MLGIELDRPCADLVQRALTKGLLINVTADRVIRLLPPLILDEAQAQLLLDGVASLVGDFLAEGGNQRH
jgi:acetylornithine aminotransferase